MTPSDVDAARGFIGDGLAHVVAKGGRGGRVILIGDSTVKALYDALCISMRARAGTNLTTAQEGAHFSARWGPQASPELTVDFWHSNHCPRPQQLRRYVAERPATVGVLWNLGLHLLRDPKKVFKNIFRTLFRATTHDSR